MPIFILKINKVRLLIFQKTALMMDNPLLLPGIKRFERSKF